MNAYKVVDGKPLGERNPKWLQDDYVKFLRFAQWRIERTGQGIIAMITNHSFLDNPTFRGMRQSLMKTFTDIYILDLHGNSKKKERTPDGGKDENVFDIQQGVAISLFVKEPGGAFTSPPGHGETSPPSPLSAGGEGEQANTPPRRRGGAGGGVTPVATVHHAELWGLREGKYEHLSEADVASTEWKTLSPTSPLYLFVPREEDLLAEYEQGWKITEIMPLNSVGVVTGQDRHSIAQTTLEAERLAQSHGLHVTTVKPILYRPFDQRFIVYAQAVVTRPRPEVMRHMLAGENLALIAARQTKEDFAVFVTSSISGHKSMAAYDINSVFPLYLYPSAQEVASGLYRADERRPNLSEGFVKAVSEKLGLEFLPHPLAPSPPAERGNTSSPLPASGEGPGVGLTQGRWRTPPELWEKLKPLARQMRREPTPAESRLWQRLRKQQVLGLKFRRQQTFDRFIVDFYCPEARLIVEVDGPIHEYTPEQDAIRQAFLESLGLRVLRFPNEAVMNSLESVVAKIAGVLGERHLLAPRIPHPLTPSPHTERGDISSPLPVDGEGQGVGSGPSFTPEDIFHYIYAIFHSPTYRSRYAEFLKTDFPRVPLTSDRDLFRSLCRLGAELVALHLMESPILEAERDRVRYPVGGDHCVEGVRYAGAEGRAYINKRQYFEGIAPELWGFQVGGYQVCEKWLKDRKGRALSYDDQVHYQKIVVALGETIRLMKEIDALIPTWPLTE